MPISWEKVIPNRPHVLETARGWYDKWIRGERASANDGAAGHGPDPDPASRFEQDTDKVEAYAEPVTIEDVVEVKETTRDVADRLEALEFAGMAQAETLKNLTDQSQVMAQQLSEMQRGVTAFDQRLQETRADAEGHRTSLDELEKRAQQLSDDLSRMAARARNAMWIGGIGVAIAIVAVALAVVR